MLIKDSFSFNFVKSYRITFFLSLALLLTSAVALVKNGLNLGIDFTGGLVFDITVPSDNLDTLRTNLEKEGYREFILQSYDTNGLMIRLSKKEIGTDQENKINAIKAIIEFTYGKDSAVLYNKVDSVGSQVGETLVKNGLLALALSFLGIMLYIWFRFQLDFGISAVLSSVYNFIVLMGFIAMFKIEFNLTSIAAILTIIGYAINDSVVVFDRIREYLAKYKTTDFEKIINDSLNSTLRRTILTGISTLLATIPLIFIGGEVLFNFGIIIFAGIIIGTYSSLFVASPALMFIKKHLKTHK